MKALFPKSGVIIVTKYNVNTLKDYYKNNLINSKLFGIYQQSNYSLQVGNFSYLPKRSEIILDDVHLLTLKQLQEYVLEQTKGSNSAAKTIPQGSKNPPKAEISDKPLDDNFIKDNPFFTTLNSYNG